MTSAALEQEAIKVVDQALAAGDALQRTMLLEKALRLHRLARESAPHAPLTWPRPELDLEAD